jgi:hypothetical protein
MEKAELKKSLRDFEKRLKALAEEMGVALEARWGEKIVVLKPKGKLDFYFPPFALLEEDGDLVLAALLPREVRRRGLVQGEELPLAVVDLDLEGEVFPAAVVGLLKVPKRPLFDEFLSELALVAFRLVLEAKDTLGAGRHLEA